MGRFSIRNATKILQSASGVIFGRKSAGTGAGEELTAADVRTLLSVYTVSQTDAAISAAVASLVDSSPAALDTLNELAAALGDDANFATTVTTALAGKAALSHTHAAADVIDFASTVNTLNAGSATILQTARTINGVSFDGSANITVTAAGSTLSDTVPVSKGGTGLTAFGSALQVLRVNAGATALEYATVSSGSPGGSSGQIQYNNAGAFGGTTAIVYATSGVHQTVTCQGSTIVAVVHKAAASQSVDITQWQSSVGVTGARVTSGTQFSNASGGALSEQFGAGAAANGYGSAAFGNSANASGYGATALAQMARATGANYPTAVGFASLVSANYSTGLGALCVSDFSGSTTVGYGSRCYASSQFVAGSTDCPHTNLFFGNGVTHASPVAYTINGTGGSGTNIVGGKVTVAGGKSTGNATPAIVAIATGTAGASGSVAQTLRDAVQVDGNTTSGETPLLLLDISAGTIKRVSIGAADSGGSGFKVLRVPN